MAECKVSEYYEPQPTEDSGETAKKSGGSLAIKQWAEDDRPREKLLAHGADGVGLYRYGSLWANTSWPGLAAAELAALA